MTIFERRFVLPGRNFYICVALFRLRLREGGLKGNRVKIPDRPAAVSFIDVPDHTRATVEKTGRRPVTEVSQKTCKAFHFDSFEV